MREKVMHLATNKEITWSQAADMLGISARHMRRLRQSWQAHGFSALMDQRGKKPRRKRITPDIIEGIVTLRKAGYQPFHVRHFYEHAELQERFGVSYSYVLRLLQDLRLADKSEGRGRYHRKRDRKAMRGMMVHLDGSTHAWLGDAQPKWDLMLALDDATSEALYGKFVPQEGSLSSIAAIESILRRHGRFTWLYTDRGSHFCRTSEKGQRPDPEQNGQVVRIGDALGIRHIPANTPQARGRSERAFGTFQDRLVQELAFEGICDYEAANRYLQEVFIPKHNQRFAVEPAVAESAYVPLDENHDLSLLLSVQHERKVANDNTVSFQRIKLQIPPQQHRFGFAKCKVTVHQFPDGTLGISHLGRLLAKFQPDGQLITNQNLAA